MSVQSEQDESPTADFALGAAIWRTGRNIRVVFDSGTFTPLYENMTEVHNVLHYRPRRTEPRPQVTRTENLVKYGRVVSETREQADKQTDRYRNADGNIPHPNRGRPAK